jgi:probable DNA repair protein
MIEGIARGWVVVTANQRAAQTLRRAYDLERRAKGLGLWQPPRIYAWETWLKAVWERLLPDGAASALLLNETQERSVWRAVIESDRAVTAATLRPVDALADLAADAWARLHGYRARARLAAAADTTDTRAFSRWAGEFERRCGRGSYLTPAQLEEALRAAVDAGQEITPTGMVLVGFDTMTPAQAALAEAFREAGSEIEEVGTEAAGGQASAGVLVAAVDGYEELSAAARWVRERLAEDPAARLAVIVPSLETERAQIERVFREVLAPELNDIATRNDVAPYEFSLGVPLAQTPMAACALSVLRWASEALPLDRIAGVLLSPHFASARQEEASEHLARAEFDAFTLRQRPLLQPELSIEGMVRIAAGSKQAAGMPVLLRQLRVLRAAVRDSGVAGTVRGYGEWAATMHELLQKAGWPAGSLDGAEFQTLRKWESALDELATLDFEGARVDFATALRGLERIARETLFAPESRHAPVQLMGPLESAGSTFDAVWFLRAADRTWPTRPAANPLLPWRLQRELAMPGADPAQDAAHARRVTARIAASAPAVVFSYARHTAEAVQRPSSTLTGLGLEMREVKAIAPVAPMRRLVELEAFADRVPVPAPPDAVLHGGAAVLRSQAACSFRAFAEHRLFSTALEPAGLGLDPRDRGSLVHQVLDQFWAGALSQDALRAMPFGERKALLGVSIDEALGKHVRAAVGAWERAYLATERSRLMRLLGDWLEYELTRRPFVVQAREQKLEDVRIGPLRLSVRVDRIDRTPDEAEIILDYKTGRAEPAAWFSERPDEPQLPLYAVLSGSANLAAVAFASVRPGNFMELKGIESHAGVLPKTTAPEAGTFAEQVGEWGRVLTDLAVAFYAGRAEVAPKKYPATCERCQQRLLCRLNPAALEEIDPDDLEAVEGAEGVEDNG